MPDHAQFMQMAIDLARAAIQTPDGRPFGAVVVVDGAVVGRGKNESVSRCDPTAHAEVMAIRDACASLRTDHLQRGILYTSCEPCPLCLAAAMWAGITDIYFAASMDDAEVFGFSDKEFYRQLALPRQERMVRSEQISRDGGIPVFEEFHDRVRRHEVRGFMPESPSL